MDPTTAHFQFYDELDDSACWGLGEIDLGNISQVKKIDYPSEVALVDSDVSPNMVEYIVDPEDDGDLATPSYANYTLNNWSMDNGNY